jgi:predicted phosphodiesterase
MARNTFWSEERKLHAFEAVLDHENLEEAARKISTDFGKEVTKNSLQKMLSSSFPEVNLRDYVGKRIRATQDKSIATKFMNLIKEVDDQAMNVRDQRPDYLKYSKKELQFKHANPANPRQRGDLRYELNPNKPTVIHVWPDAHVPLHDPGTVEACTMFAEYMVPDIVIDLGDFLDLEEVSAHDPVRVHRGESGFLYESIIPGREILKNQGERLTAAGVKRRAMLGGNHEKRMHAYIVKKCPELYEMMPTIAGMLELEESGWDFVAYGGAIRVGPVQFTHGRGHSKFVAAKTMEKEGSTVFGHTHRVQTFLSNTRPGYPELGMTCGTRGQLIHDYEYHAPNDHMHAMGIVIIYPDGQTQMIPVLIYDGILSYHLPGGKMLEIDGNKKIIREI